MDECNLRKFINLIQSNDKVYFLLIPLPFIIVGYWILQLLGVKQKQVPKNLKHFLLRANKFSILAFWNVLEFSYFYLLFFPKNVAP